VKPTIAMLEGRISAAMAAATGLADCEAQVCPATDPKFGDYQANGVMPLAKQIKADPRKLAEKVVENLDVSDVCEPPEVAGPGFINLRLKADFVADRLLQINTDPENRLGVEKTGQPKTIVVDFSGPNIAKQMHVGHLRSTIIGDCICRLLEFLGHTVIRQNHIGDWGIPMGMVVYALEDVYWEQDEPKLNLEILEQEYKRIVELEKEDPEIADKVRKRTAELQAKEPLAKRYWQEACGITMRECYRLYVMMGVNLSTIHTVGESFYADKLKDVVDSLRKNKLSKESDGAICVFPESFKNKEGEPLPLIIQKSDGAYLYATTDLAAIRYRVDELKADRVIYVTDARQSLHFQMVFAVADMASWTKRNDYKTQLIHVTFGSVLGENGKPLKTREGENVKLKELLNEAVERAQAIVEEKNPKLDDKQKKEIAEAVGVGAVKYADYSNNRTSDYIFSFDKMLAMEGNTAPYMQYAYARIKSMIVRKAEQKNIKVEKELKAIADLNLTEPSELDLAKHLIRYVEAIQAAAADYRPNYLTSYLYELAQKFSVFYTNCPVLDAKQHKRPTRLLLCDLTAKTIKHGLSELLGIEVVEQM